MEIKVYHPLEDCIRNRAYQIWVDDGQKDGDEIVDLGLGPEKRSHYHWVAAKVAVEAESDAAMRRMGPCKMTLGEGYYHLPSMVERPKDQEVWMSKCEFKCLDYDGDESIAMVGNTKYYSETNLQPTIPDHMKKDFEKFTASDCQTVVDPDTFTPSASIITKFGKKLLKGQKKSIKNINMP